jgi:hypothetical protein
VLALINNEHEYAVIAVKKVLNIKLLERRGVVYFDITELLFRGVMNFIRTENGRKMAAFWLIPWVGGSIIIPCLTLTFSAQQGRKAVFQRIWCMGICLLHEVSVVLGFFNYFKQPFMGMRICMKTILKIFNCCAPK